MNSPGYLCFAWGESDHPVFRYCKTPEEVGRFFGDEWFGEQYEDMRPDRRSDAYEEAMRMVRAERDDPDSWDGTDSIAFEFEIGGVRVTRCFESAGPLPAAPVEAVVPSDERQPGWFWRAILAATAPAVPLEQPAGQNADEIEHLRSAAQQARTALSSLIASGDRVVYLDALRALDEALARRGSA